MIVKTSYEYNKVWRKNHPESRAKDRRRYYAQFQGAENTGKSWTESEDVRVLARDVTDRELSAEIGRSVQAIQIRRGRINK